MVLRVLEMERTAVNVGSGATGTVIGGTTGAERNVISNNTQNNIVLSSVGTTVQGNYIGTDATGMALPDSLGQGRVGIRVGDDIKQPNRRHRTRCGKCHFRSFRRGDYLEPADSSKGGAQGTQIQGNSIGTTADGLSPLLNGVGIEVAGFVDTNGHTRRDHRSSDWRN